MELQPEPVPAATDVFGQTVTFPVFLPSWGHLVHLDFIWKLLLGGVLRELGKYIDR